MIFMASQPDTTPTKQSKPAVLGRSAVTGRFVFAPAASKRGTVSEKWIADAVKTVLSRKK